MAFLLEDGCKICFNGYNGSDQLSVALPCSHSFCITCLTQMRSNDNHTCPVCRADWTHLQMTVDIKPKEIEADYDKDSKNTVLKEDEAKALCPDHSLSYLFWCNDCKEFFCKRCATTKHRTCSYDVIEDCTLNVEHYFNNEVDNTILKIQGNSNVLHAAHIQASEKLSSVTKLLEALTKHQHNLTDHVKQLEDMISRRSQDMESVKQYGSKVETFSKGPDISGILKCIKKLNEFSMQIIPPAPDVGMMQLNNFANTFAKENQEDAKVAATLRGGASWDVTAANWRAAVVALAEVQPSVLTLISNTGLSGALPLHAVAAVAGAVKSCPVEIEFFDSFYEPEDPSIDRQRLEILLANPSFHLDVFAGHLDAAGIARLPQTVTELYLAISNASDAAAISNIVWDNLIDIGVSVASSVAPEDLQPLPEFEAIQLFFYGTTDSQIIMMAPAILALLPKKRCSFIRLVNSQLTADGLLLLAQQLRGVAVSTLVIEPRGAWRPGKKKRKIISNKICRAVNGRCDVIWE